MYVVVHGPDPASELGTGCTHTEEWERRRDLPGPLSNRLALRADPPRLRHLRYPPAQ